jgi:hypothetical protein
MRCIANADVLATGDRCMIDGRGWARHVTVVEGVQLDRRRPSNEADAMTVMSPPARTDGAGRECDTIQAIILGIPDVREGVRTDVSGRREAAAYGAAVRSPLRRRSRRAEEDGKTCAGLLRSVYLTQMSTDWLAVSG